MKISVVVPVYKVEQYLYRCIQSILQQTFSDYEIILIDDGSPDKCGDMCDELAKADSRIHVIHQRNRGLSAARNAGIEWAIANSDSRYIAFVDSDDWLHLRCFEVLCSVLEQTNAVVAVCGHKHAETCVCDDMTRRVVANPEVLSAEELLIRHPWNFNYAWAKLYKKELFLTLRYPEGKIFEDTFTTYKALFNAKTIVFVEDELYFYFRNQAGISKSPWKPSELAVLDGMREQLAFYEENAFSRAYETEMRLFINHHAYQIQRIRENKTDYAENKHYIPMLKKEMFQMIAADKKKYGFFVMPQCYDAAYPWLKLWFRLRRKIGRWRKM